MKKLIILFLSLLTLSACSNNGSDNVITKSGTVEAREVTVSAKVGGTLEKLLKAEGDLIKKGDTVAILDTKITELQFEKSLAALSAAKDKLTLMVKGARKEDLIQAKENLKQAKLSYGLAAKEFKRAKNLLREKSIPQNKFDDIKTKYEIATSRLKQSEIALRKIKNLFRPEEIQQAKANVKAAEAQLEILKQNLKDAVITSPENGIISKIYYKEGENVLPFGSIFKVENLAKPKIKIYIPETQLGKIKPGQEAEIFSDSFKEKYFRGKVTYISPKAEFTPKTIQTKEERVKLVFEVKIVAENPNLELKSGMPVDVKLELKSK